MRKIVVLGCGFLGNKLIDSFLGDPATTIVGFDRNVPGQSHDRVQYVQGSFASGYDFASLVRGADLVIHLVSTSVPGTEKRSLDEIQANVIPSVELFDACMAEGVGRLVFLSSGGTVYGSSPYRANRETDPPAPYNTYGLQKVMIEQALQLTAHYGDMQYQIIRLSNPYGPGQNPHGPLGLVTKLVYQAVNHETIHIFGDGSVVRDFIYIDDAIQGILDIIARGTVNTIYNLGRGTGASVAEVTAAIERIVPERIIIDHEPARKVDIPYSVLDIAKYRQITSLRRFISLEEGIRRTYAFFTESRQ
ncbi:NAD-dependent epimerase/dehydratase family protein [Bifidobacterium amazonense]|uniref:NAD-dependent epimerase/dehydratase family protein n=1 Tax=Bifidobacterium amazonense TaxID=2809027 RepID=A0ABS9VX32_9BIFI|nr:NAD-dependent epimerase/dehydratase family protein [Bifidobacterium amazonense]MCH9276639.1 NAD-dependent epimerase/dehydratase family protein [Bifidobacterium amazonense]